MSPRTIYWPTKLPRFLPSKSFAASLVFTSSANAVVSKRGSEAYDVSKAAVSHLIRELAVSLSPRVRVNGISPAAVVQGSTMFPRDRVIASLKKYGIAFRDEQTDEELRSLLGRLLRTANADASAGRAGGLRSRDSVFGQRHRRVAPRGHIIPVDGGLPEAFLR